MNNKIIELFKSGCEEYNKGEFTASIKDFNECIKIDPGNAKAYCNRALAKFQLKKHKSALNDFEKALNLTPKDSAIWANRGFIHYHFGKYNLSLKDLDSALELNPDYSKAFAFRIGVKAKLADFMAAINDYDLFLAKHPNNKEFMHYTMLSLKDILNEADQKFNHNIPAIMSDNNSPKTYYVLGMLHYLDNEYRNAEINFSKAIKLCQDNSDLYSLRGSTRKKIKKFRGREVFYDYKKAYELDPHYENLFDLAKQQTLFYSGEEDEENLEYINKFIDEEPEYEEAGEAYFCRANAYFYARQYKEAAEDYSKAMQYDCIGEEVSLRRAECYFFTEDTKKALKDLRRASEFELDDEQKERLAILNGDIRNYNLKDYKGALPYYEEVIKNYGKSDDYWYEIAQWSRADMLYKLEKYDEAISAYTEIDKYYNVGKIYFQKQEYKKAISNFNKALKNREYDKENIYYYRGCAKRELGNLQDAEKDFKLYETKTYIKEPFAEDKTLEYYRRNYNKDLISIGYKLKNEPMNADLYYKRAVVLISCKKHIDALNDLDKVINIAPDRWQAYLQRAKVKCAMNDISGKYNDIRKGFLLQLKECERINKKSITLYLYRPLNKHTFSLLKNNYFWFSHPSDFNDPLDSRFYQNAIKEDDLLKVLKEVRIRSFAKAEITKNTLLWSHYADKHKGIVIEYEINTEELKNNNIVLCDVAYSDSLMRETRPKMSDYGRSFFTKSESWSYENEWRMVTLSHNLEDGHKLNRGFKIKNIIFGLMTNNEDIKKVKIILGNKCKYYKMEHYDKLRSPFTLEKIRL